MSADETSSKQVKTEDPLNSPTSENTDSAGHSLSGKVPRAISSINQFAGKCPRTTRSGKRPFSAAFDLTQGSTFQTMNFSDYSSSNSDSETEMIPTSATLSHREGVETDEKPVVPSFGTKETRIIAHSQPQTHVDVEQEDGTRPTFSVVQTKESEEKQKLESIYNDTIITPVPLDIYNRLKALEDKIIQLEETHPAWCAIHFNQPDRQFPPPPPITYVTRNSWGGITVPRKSFCTDKGSSNDI